MDYKFNYTIVYNGKVVEVNELTFSTVDTKPSFEKIKEYVSQDVKAIKLAYMIKNKLNKADLQHIIVSVELLLG